MDPSRGNLWLGLVLTGLIAAALWEARIWIIGLRSYFGLNFGRAFLVWVSPFFYFFIWVVLLSVLRFISMATS